MYLDIQKWWIEPHLTLVALDLTFALSLHPIMLANLCLTIFLVYHF